MEWLEGRQRQREIERWTGREREREHRLRGVIKRYSFLMWSQGLCFVAVNVALKYITHPNRSRWGSLPGGLQWKVRRRRGSDRGKREKGADGREWEGLRWR